MPAVRSRGQGGREGVTLKLSPSPELPAPYAAQTGTRATGTGEGAALKFVFSKAQENQFMKHARTCLAVLAGLVLAAAGAWAAAAQEEPAAAMEKEMVTDPTTGEMVTAPQYGGTLTAATPSDPAGSDAYFGHPTMKAIEQVCEMLPVSTGRSIEQSTA